MRTLWQKMRCGLGYHSLRPSGMRRHGGEEYRPPSTRMRREVCIACGLHGPQISLLALLRDHLFGSPWSG